jgi:cold shock CspA family protein
MSETTDAARLIAKLLANRRTSLEEIPALIENVRRALAELDANAEEIAIVPVTSVKRQHARVKRDTPSPSPPVAQLPEPVPKPAPSLLVRRAEVVSVAPIAPSATFAPAAVGTVRGVVQWFDSRTGQGTLRLPGMSRDVPIDAVTLARFGISRLFKGQEIEARVEALGETPKVVEIHLANAIPVHAMSGGTVLDRHAKPVVVELKGEAPRRSAARAEAELLLPSQRGR